MPEIFQINGTLVIFVISFLLFMVALDIIFLKPVGRVMEERAEGIQNDTDRGRDAREEAEGILGKYHSHLAEIRNEAQTIVSGAIESANDERRKKLDIIKESGRKKVGEARAAIAEERVALIDGLVQQEVELVENICRKLLGEKSTVSVDRKKVHEALEEAC